MQATSIRVPLLIAALIMIALAVMTELGFAIAAPYWNAAEQGLSAAGSELSTAEPPGIAIYYLGVLDSLVLFTVALLAAPLALSHQYHAKAQGFATLIAGIATLVIGIFLLLAAITKLMLMVALLLAFPFGTIAYLAAFANFARPLATGILATLLFLKVGAAVCLPLAHEGMLKNKGLLLILFTSLIGHVVVGMLHGFVPRLLVSITDAIAAIVVVILAIVWGLFFLFGSLPAIFKAIKPA